MKNAVCLLFLCLYVAGCTLTVTAAQPRPNIALAPRPEKLSLKLGPDVKDQYRVPPQQGLQAVNVAGWNSTLQTGFDSAFGSLFQGSGEGLVLSIDRADLVVTPAAVGTYGVAAVRAQVTYRAQLMSESGNVIAISAATAESKGTTASPSQADMTRLAGDAVESMYELIAKELFQTPPKS